MAAHRYERVRFRDGGRVRTVFLRDPVANRLLLRGVEVNVEGDEVAGVPFDERVRVISTGLVLSRKVYVMSRRYAELVPRTKRGRP